MSYFKTIAIDQTTPGTTNGVQVNAALPAGTNVIGHVIVDSGAVTATVSGVATASKQDTGNTSVASIDTKTPALGQALAAASVPVVLTAAQLTTLTPPSAITGYATETTLAGVLTTSDFDTKTGALTEIAPATDTASSGVNGRLQRIAQRISSLITALGSPFQAGGSIGNTSFAATQATASSLNATVVGSGSAGTAATGVVTIQGIASMTKLLVTPDANSSANIAQVGGTTVVTGGVNGSLGTGGNVAHDGVNAGNPDLAGAEAIAFGSNPTAVAAADRTKLYANRAGVPFVLSGHPNIITRRDNYTSAQTDTKLITVSSGAKIVVVSCTIASDAATSTKPVVRAGFAASTTPTGAGVYISHPGLSAGSGIREAGAVAGADGDDFIFTCAAPTSGSLDVVTKYFTIES